MDYKVNDLVKCKTKGIRYKITDIFNYENTSNVGYVLKDTWNKYSQPKIINKETLKSNYDRVNNNG